MSTITPLHAQPSIIDHIQQQQDAFVSVQAQNTDIFKSPPVAMARDPQSGRIVVAQGIKAASYDRSGAGVVIDPSGIIITNSHIVYRSEKIIVSFSDGTALPAKVLLVVHNLDLAFLKIAVSEPIQSITIADSDNVQLGDEIINIGNSPLLKQTMTGGKIIGLGVTRKYENDQETALLQTTINIYEGDSGGPLLDYQGRLIGLMTAKESSADHSSFAVPSNKIQEFLNEIKTQPNK